MTISTTTNRVSFAGNGSTTAFSFPYYFAASTDLLVILRTSAGVETTKTLTTHYTVTGADSSSGGTVTMVTAPASGETLYIVRDPALTQSLDLVENDAFPAATAETRLDRITVMIQRMKDLGTRSVRMTDASATSFDPSLPAVLTALYVLRVNTAGTGFELVAQSSFTFDGAAPTTTKGDIIVRSSTINDRLAVGANGKVLTADSSQTLGVKWEQSPFFLGAPAWIEDASAPLSAFESGLRVYNFEAGITQYLYTAFRVPQSYIAGNQISLRLHFLCSSTTNNVLLQTVATLIRPGTDAISSTTNQRTSTTASVALSAGTQNIPQSISFDLTSTTGTINSVAVSAGALILIQFTRAAASPEAANEVRVPIALAEVTFI